MHITALCPFCRSAYQVQAALQGQLVRCPNAACRKAFSVPPDAPEIEPPAAPTSSRPNTPPGNNQRSGSVGELVPIMPAEQATPSRESGTASKHVSEILPVAPVSPVTGDQPAEGNWWQVAPPVRSPAELGNERQTPPGAPSSEPPADAAWWHDTPPVRNPQALKSGETPVPPAQAPPPSPPTQRLRRPVRRAGETQPMAALPPEKPGQTRELPPGAWEPPPVRRGAESEGQAAQAVEESTAVHSQAELGNESQPRLSKRRAWIAIVSMFLFLVIVFVPLGVWVLQKVYRSEEALSKEAHSLYDQGSFTSAADMFRQIADKFSASGQAEEYRFLADWSGVCGVVSDPDADLPAAATRLDQFVQEHKKDPLMERFGRDAGQRLLNLAKALAARNADSLDESSLKAADRIEQLRRTLTSLRADALTKNEFDQIGTDLGKVRQAVELAIKRRDVLAQLHKQDKETPMDAIKRARSLLARTERELSGISQSSEAKAALSRLEEAHLASVVYHRATEAPALPTQPPGDDADVLPFAPLVPPAATGTAPPNDPIVLALARGVLYALKQYNGDLKWATQVGIDTTVLPERVPASAFSPELLLVLSADTQTLSALNLEGDSLWEYHVGQPVLGRPIVIDQRAYLADYNGWVHEIELSGGQLLGRWSLGQPLTCGGAREIDSSGEASRIYFPADDSCIYVLDVKAHRCVTILYDGHPSGSLRSEPVIIPPEGDAAPGYLILNQASGLDAMQLRVFELPIQDRHASSLELEPPANFAGWTWFAPKQDGEKLAVLSDAGVLGLFGIRQLGNRDPSLFPLLQPGGLDLSAFLHQPIAAIRGREPSRERGRAQVTHMQGDDLWVLAHGRFQQLHLRLDSARGPQAVPGWKTPLRLGSPLHEPQRIEDRNNGHSSFFLVTQALEQQTCLATKVDEEGHILWQRQLGLVCQGEPLALTPPKGGPPLLLALDRGGGLFVLDPQQPVDKLRSNRRTLAPALEENPLVPPRLLLAADGRSAYEVAVPGNGQWLVVRHIEWAGGERKLRVHEHQVTLETPTGVITPAGPPAVTNSHLLIPMSDGNVKGLPLAELLPNERPRLETGPRWRDQQHPPVISPSILALRGARFQDRFLITNGNRRLSVYEWPPGKDKGYQFLPKEGEGEPLKPLEYLVAAPPVLLPGGADQPPRVVIADSAGMLRLFTVTPDGSLQPGLLWELKGTLTAGPFVQAAPKGGWRIGCVLDRSCLSWIDPEKTGTLWTYSTGDPAILGQPQRVEDMLVAALQSGCYVGIDPKTGQSRNAGYTLRTSAAPAAAPMSFGPGRMFAPLSDGTALLLSVELLKNANHRVTENAEKKIQK